MTGRVTLPNFVSCFRFRSLYLGPGLQGLLPVARRSWRSRFATMPGLFTSDGASAPGPESATDPTPTPQDAGPARRDIVGEGRGDVKFLYFAYGSNLLARRLHLMNPTARRHSIGELKGYRLDFSTPASKRWGGAPATVVPDPEDSVWGAIWSLDIEDRDHLDEQESVHSGLYDVFNATVQTPDGEVLLCRSYLMRVVPPKLQPGEARPAHRQPSLVYKKVLTAGARESGLPADYTARLEAVADNGSAGSNPPISLESLQSLQSSEASGVTPAPAPAAR